MSKVERGNPNRAWLFPGQGSQVAGMGVDLLARFADVRRLCDSVLDFDIAEACTGENGHLNRTDQLQPTLYTVNYLHALALRETEGWPAVMAGHSLGEISALAVSGFLDFEQGLRLVAARGRLMHAVRDGGMAAAVRIERPALLAVLEASGLTTVDIANWNSGTETVLSGPVADLALLKDAVRAAGGILIPLKVGAAFHSRYMAGAADSLGAVLAGIVFKPGRVPVLSNVTALEYTPQDAARLLARQVREPVRWSDCMQALRRRGVTEIDEVGPGGVLRKLWAANPSDNGARSNGSPIVVAAAPTRETFCAAYRVRHAYVAGSMYRAISSVELVERMAKSGYLAFFGTGGISRTEIDSAVARLARTCAGLPYGLNILSQPERSAAEQWVVDAALRANVTVLEASAYTTLSAPLVQYRYSGSRLTAGTPYVPNRIIAKVSRGEVARKFLLPPSKEIIDDLRAKGLLTVEEARVAELAPVASDICVESDSGGHTDRGAALVLIPSILSLRTRIGSSFPASRQVRIGAAGGLGTPSAIAAVLTLGAEFVLTGSINQCTPEAGTSDSVKDLLATLGVHDMALAPAADLFEVDGQVQVVRKGTLFAARANRLQRVYREHGRWEEVDLPTRSSIERRILKDSYDSVLEKVRSRYVLQNRADRLRVLEQDPRQQLAAVFTTYLVHTTVAAIEGDAGLAADFQIHCGPALGAFNEWVQGSALEDWRNRHVDTIADALLAAVRSDSRNGETTGNARSELDRVPDPIG
ncbi:PfaD family polyunsaturated fatty acid/polyketide biosynthesis protein [Nocardia suismassiliense]|uniref:[acyl-carrier-protein] S-malonyltransferase n=1 Tax=Nocardia suismassiliense TaxID=2077092 RepID=A0ABW6R0S5_9NOCA